MAALPVATLLVALLAATVALVHVYSDVRRIPWCGVAVGRSTAGRLCCEAWRGVSAFG